MEVRYLRGTENSYMILSANDIDEKRYDIGMLRSNRIRGFLPMEIKQMNGELLFYYDITGRQSIAQVYRKMQMKGTDLVKLLEGILEGFEQGDRFMLDPEQILLSPEYVYMDRTDGKIALCYIPGRVPEEEEAGEDCFTASGSEVLAAFILKHLDHGDPEAVTLGYRFYQEVSDGGSPVRVVIKDCLEDRRKAEISSENDPSKNTLSKNNAMRDASLGNVSPKDDFSKDISSEDIPDFLNREEEGRNRPKRETGLYMEQTVKEKTRRRKEKANIKPRKREERELPYEGYGKRTARKLQDIGNAKKPNRKLSEEGHRKKPDRKIPVWFLILILVAVLFNAGIDWYFTFDLTQIGGMAFGSIALIWLVYTVCIERIREQESPWEEFFAEMEQREEEFLYDDEADDINERSDPPNEIYARKETYGSIRRKDSDYEQDNKPDDEQNNEQEDTTRVLAVKQERPVFILIGETPHTGDIRLEEGSRILGKSSAQSDICLPSSAVSRVHAQVDVKDGILTLTDLNSRNGTYVNEKQLQPNESCHPVVSDRIRFADVSYFVKEVFY